MYAWRNGLSRKTKGNTLFEMSTLELFWGKPNGQFFVKGGG
jgi:hypothetical protein